MKESVRNSLLHLIPFVVRRQSVGNVQARRILLMRPDHIGDILFTTPALRLLRSQLPDAHIAFLVGPWSRTVLENNTNVDELITWDFPWFNRRKKSSIAEPYVVLSRLARSLQYYCFDAVINFRFDFWWGGLASYLAGIPQRIGYNTEDCSPFLTHKFQYVNGRHEVEQNIDLVARFLQLSDEKKQQAGRALEFNITDEDDEFGVSYLRSHGARQGDFLVALHPGSGSPLKQWDTEKFARVGDELAYRHGAVVIITGSSSERDLATEIASKMRSKCIVAAGDTSLAQLAAILRYCKLAIGVDSGAMHLAVAVGTPTIHLFGPSDHRIFGPFGDKHKHRVVQASLSCSPCGRFDFASAGRVGDCMSSISVESVLNEAVSLLESRSET